MRAAAEAMGLPLDTVPVVTMDKRSHELAAADVFAAFERGDVSRKTIDEILAQTAGNANGQIRTDFQREIALRLTRFLGRSIC